MMRGVNTITRIWVIVFLMFLIGCSEEFLEIPLKGRLSTENFVPEQAVIGCYAAFYSNDWDWSIWGAWNSNVFGNILSDDAYKGGNSEGDQAEMGLMERFEMMPSNGTIGNFYSLYYHYIFFFNSAIQGLEQADYLEENLKNRYLGEVRFLRAYAYFRLMTAFGSKNGNSGLVLIDRPLKQHELGNIGRSSYQDTWDFIINDLMFAEEHLPLKSQYSINDLGRATKGAAQALLARTYMYMNEWEKCEEYCKKVIDSKEYALEPEFKNTFSKSHKHGKESIFEIGYTIDTYFGTGGFDFSHGAWWASAQMPMGRWGGWGIGPLTQDLLEEFMQDPGDPRIVWTFLFAGDKDISTAQQVELTFNEGVNPDKKHLRKLWDPLYFQMGGQADNNLMVLRYADVLLMYAEALNENNKPAEALTALNQIRKRARESTFVDPYRIVVGYSFPYDMETFIRVPDVIADDKILIRKAIWHERRVELAGEGIRYFDLVRQGRAGEVLREFSKKYKTNKGAGFVDGKHESMPIPQDEISLSQGNVKQNPKY